MSYEEVLKETEDKGNTKKGNLISLISPKLITLSNMCRQFACVAAREGFPGISGYWVSKGVDLYKTTIDLSTMSEYLQQEVSLEEGKDAKEIESNDLDKSFGYMLHEILEISGTIRDEESCIMTKEALKGVEKHIKCLHIANATALRDGGLDTLNNQLND